MAFSPSFYSTSVSSTKIPLSLTVSFSESQLVKSPIIRCSFCKSYFNLYFEVFEKYFRCNLCGKDSLNNYKDSDTNSLNSNLETNVIHNNICNYSGNNVIQNNSIENNSKSNFISNNPENNMISNNSIIPDHNLRNNPYNHDTNNPNPSFTNTKIKNTANVSSGLNSSSFSSPSYEILAPNLMYKFTPVHHVFLVETSFFTIKNRLFHTLIYAFTSHLNSLFSVDSSTKICFIFYNSAAFVLSKFCYQIVYDFKDLPVFDNDSIFFTKKDLFPGKENSINNRNKTKNINLNNCTKSENKKNIFSNTNYENENKKNISSNINYENENQKNIISNTNYENENQKNICKNTNYENENQKNIFKNVDYENENQKNIFSNINDENENKKNFSSNSNYENENQKNISKDITSENRENIIKNNHENESDAHIKDLNDFKHPFFNGFDGINPRFCSSSLLYRLSDTISYFKDTLSTENALNDALSLATSILSKTGGVISLFTSSPPLNSFTDFKSTFFTHKIALNLFTFPSTNVNLQNIYKYCNSIYFHPNYTVTDSITIYNKIRDYFSIKRRTDAIAKLRFSENVRIKKILTNGVIKNNLIYFSEYSDNPINVVVEITDNKDFYMQSAMLFTQNGNRKISVNNLCIKNGNSCLYDINPVEVVRSLAMKFVDRNSESEKVYEEINRFGEDILKDYYRNVDKYGIKRCLEEGNTYKIDFKGINISRRDVYDNFGALNISKTSNRVGFNHEIRNNSVHNPMLDNTHANMLDNTRNNKLDTPFINGHKTMLHNTINDGLQSNMPNDGQSKTNSRSGDNFDSISHNGHSLQTSSAHLCNNSCKNNNCDYLYNDLKNEHIFSYPGNLNGTIINQKMEQMKYEEIKIKLPNTLKHLFVLLNALQKNIAFRRVLSTPIDYRIYYKHCFMNLKEIKNIIYGTLIDFNELLNEFGEEILKNDEIFDELLKEYTKLKSTSQNNIVNDASDKKDNISSDNLTNNTHKNIVNNNFYENNMHDSVNLINKSDDVLLSMQNEDLLNDFLNEFDSNSMTEKSPLFYDLSKLSTNFRQNLTINLKNINLKNYSKKLTKKSIKITNIYLLKTKNSNYLFEGIKSNKIIMKNILINECDKNNKVINETNYNIASKIFEKIIKNEILFWIKDDGNDKLIKDVFFSNLMEDKINNCENVEEFVEKLERAK